MERPDDAAFRLHVDLFAALRRFLPVAILGSALVAPLGYAEPSTAMWYAAALFAASLFLLRALSGLPLYPAHTFGVEYRFEDHPFDGGRRRCVRCEAIAADGVHRRYARQLVVLGVPVYTLAWGSNDFCPDCLGAPDGRGAGGDRDVPSEPTGSVGDSRGSAAEPADSAGDPAGTDAGSAAGTDRPGTGIARRIDPNDETTALELRRAFDEDGAAADTG